MKKKKLIPVVIITFILIITMGITFAFYEYMQNGTSNNLAITGDIYMHYTDTNGFTFSNAMPMSKEEALKEEDNIFNFSITGKNDSDII